MISGDFVREFQNCMAKPAILTSPIGEDRILIPPGFSDITPKLPTAGVLQINTLSGIVHFIEKNVDGLLWPQCLVHVLDHARVELRSNLASRVEHYQRHTYLAATIDAYGKGFPFGVFQDAETFFIGLQSQFVQTAQRDEILMLLASIRESAVRDTVDTGVAQEVKTAGGVVLVGSTKVPNPVALQPYRTFREVAQPESLFVLRLQSGTNGEKPRCALFEADGGTWKLEAVQRVSQYLVEKLAGAVAVIA